MKFTLFTTLCFAGIISYGQIGKGAKTLSADVLFSKEKSDGLYMVDPYGDFFKDPPATFNSFVVSPSVGFFLADKSQLLIGAYYGYGKAEYDSEFILYANKKQQLLGLSLGYKRYIQIAENFYFSPRVMAQMGLEINDVREPLVVIGDDHFSYQYAVFQFSLLPEFTYQLSDRWLAEAKLGGLEVAFRENGFNGLVTSPFKDQSKVEYTLSMSNVRIGFTYILVKKREE